jgi:hypothetical protein
MRRIHGQFIGGSNFKCHELGISYLLFRTYHVDSVIYEDYNIPQKATMMLNKCNRGLGENIIVSYRYRYRRHSGLH